MRQLARALLIAMAFTIPWEYSLDFGEPYGNIARLLGLLLLAAVIPAIVRDGRLRAPGAGQWCTLIFLVWTALTYYWSIAPTETSETLRGYFQELMLVWIVWELADQPIDLRNLLRAYVAGSWVLAGLTLATVRTLATSMDAQMRFVAEGQDPNDVARFLDLGLPLAALLVGGERRRMWRWLALGYLPIGLLGVVLTASRGGFLAAMVALVGGMVLVWRMRPRVMEAVMLSIPLWIGLIWQAIPTGVIERLSTIPQQLGSGDLNQRMNIWQAGWQAFASNPLAGSGAGAFVHAARVANFDTAHNTVLSIAVGAGVCGLLLAATVLASAVVGLRSMRGNVRIAMMTALAVWCLTTLSATVEENRTTWLLLALLFSAGRMSVEQPGQLAAQFAEQAHG